jgi:hypothetical protein
MMKAFFSALLRGERKKERNDNSFMEMSFDI